MKSQIYVFIALFFTICVNNVVAQPKISIDLGFGYYEPTLSGFDDNESVQFPTKNIINRNLLLNWGVYYEFFHNARIGYNSFNSYDIGKSILLVNSDAVFQRSIKYRMFPIETFFRWKPKIELNFTLTPIWGRARIAMDTTPGDKTEDWNFFISSFGGEANPVSDLGSTDVMVTDWFGYGSMLGMRYYLNTRIALDVKAGFMNHYYNNKKWRIQRQSVNGPEMKINDLPLFSFKVTYGIR
tara:strand:+ start:64 stop:783 length:720 start_codon:yes stop_codon:yes gene_type:complete